MLGFSVIFFIISFKIFQGRKRKIIPESDDDAGNEGLFNCVSVQMGYQIQQLCIKSIYDYTKYILESGVSLSLLLFIPHSWIVERNLGAKLIIFFYPFLNNRFNDILFEYKFMIKDV